MKRWEENEHWVEIDLDLCKASGECVNVCPVEVYEIINGKVNWLLGFTLAIGNAIGAYIGSNFAVSKGDKWIRVVLVIVISIMSAKLLGIIKLG